jgi:hypothetical protein
MSPAGLTVFTHTPPARVADVVGLTPVTRSHVPRLSLGRARARDRQRHATPSRARGIDKGHRAPPAPLRLDPPSLFACQESDPAEAASPAVRTRKFTAGAVPKGLPPLILTPRNLATIYQYYHHPVGVGV